MELAPTFEPTASAAIRHISGNRQTSVSPTDGPDAVRPPVRRSSCRASTALCRFAGFLSTGQLALTWDGGTTAPPSVGAELIATPAAPYPWSNRICTNTPSAERPMRIGGGSNRPDHGSEMPNPLH